MPVDWKEVDDLDFRSFQFKTIAGNVPDIGICTVGVNPQSGHVLVAFPFSFAMPRHVLIDSRGNFAFDLEFHPLFKDRVEKANRVVQAAMAGNPDFNPMLLATFQANLRFQFEYV